MENNIWIVKFFLKRKSKIYSGLICLVPFLILAKESPINLYLLILAASVAIFLSVSLVPKFIKFIIHIEDAVNLKLARVTPARLLRVMFHVLFVLMILMIIGVTDGYNEPYFDLSSMTLFFVLLGASNGLHAVAVSLAYRGYGDRVSNITLSFAISSSLIGLCFFHSIGLGLSVILSVIFILHIFLGILSDTRAIIYPKAGVGVFLVHSIQSTKHIYVY